VNETQVFVQAFLRQFQVLMHAYLLQYSTKRNIQQCNLAPKF